MTDTLKATLRGASRADLVTRATTLAASYFGVPCVAVALVNATVSGDADAPKFEASCVAQEHHDVEGKSYGPGICRGCGAKDWPHDRLIRAQAVSVGGSE